MADVNISKYRASVVRDGSKPATQGFVVSEGQDPVDPPGNAQNHLPVTINATATALSITESQILSGAGTVGQYIRGDGSLADFPASSGGGSSVSYYLNGSVNQGTFGGVNYKELNKVPVLGAGTDFTIAADGYIAQFLTDAGDPNLLEIPAGNWNLETYFSASSGGGSPSFYVELYKYDGSTFTLIASNSSFPELIAFGTNVIAYYSALAVPTTVLALTDRLAIRYYVTHSGRTITLHTEDNHLCQVVTTFTTGLTSLNGLTAQVQNLAVGTSGTDFNIASATATHTFNLPTASSVNRGALSSADWTTFNNKQNAGNYVTTDTAQNITGVKTFGNNNLILASYFNANPTYLTNSGGSSSYQSGFNFFGFNTDNHIYFAKSSNTGANTGILAWSNTATRTYTLKDASGTLAFTSDIPSLSGYVQGSGTTNYLPKFTGASTIGNSNLINDASGNLGLGVTPNNWTGTGVKAFQFQNGALSASNSIGTLLSFNAYFDSGFKYISSSVNTGAYLIEGNQHNWYVAPSGTAGNAISFTQAMTLDASGRLGIGTSSPDVYGFGASGRYLTLQNTGGFSLIQVISNGTDGSGINFGNATIRRASIDAINGSHLEFYTNGTNSGTSVSPRMRITSGGNVLIGTTTDNGSRFQVTGSNSGSLPLLNLVASGTGTFQRGVRLLNSGMNVGDHIMMSVGQADGARNMGQMYFQYNGSGSTSNRLSFGLHSVDDVLNILGTGNVLIGTTSDNGARLQVSGAATFSSSVTAAGATFSGTTAVASAGATSQMRIDRVSGVARIQNYDNGSAANISLAYDGGNVGIGTNSPNVNGLSTALTINGSSTSGLEINANSVNQGYLIASTTSMVLNARTNIPLLFYTNDTERLRITSGGNVLIGTIINGSSKLKINGLPTSSAGLASGDVWNDSGTLKIA